VLLLRVFHVCVFVVLSLRSSTDLYIIVVNIILAFVRVAMRRVHRSVDLDIRRRWIYLLFLWDKILHLLCHSLNTSVSSSTGYSAFEMVYGRRAHGVMAILRQGLEGRDRHQNVLKMPTAK